MGRGFGLVTLQSRRTRKNEKRREGEKKRNTAAERKARVWEGGAGDASIYSKGAWSDDVTADRAAARAGRSRAAARGEGRERKRKA